MTSEAMTTDPAAETITTAQRIKIARVEKGWTQKQLAAAVPGLSQGNLSRYEKGVANPSGDTVDRIMRAIGKTHTLAAVDGVLGIQGRAAGKLIVVDPMATPTKVDWIVEGFVARGFLTMIAGEPGAGKSMATQTLAVGLVEGREEVAGFKLHHGRKAYRECIVTAGDDCTIAGRVDGSHSHPVLDTRVMVLDAENGPNLIQERVQGMGLDADQAARYVVAASDGFDIYKDRKDLDAMIADYREAGTPLDLLVIDSFTSLWFGNESVVEQVMPCLKSLNDLAAKHNIGILLIHHTGKDGEYRGSSAISGTIGGGLFTFTRYNEKDGEDPTARQIECTKLRIAAEPARKRVYVTGHGIDSDPDTAADNIMRAVAERVAAEGAE